MSKTAAIGPGSSGVTPDLSPIGPFEVTTRIGLLWVLTTFIFAVFRR